MTSVYDKQAQLVNALKCVVLTGYVRDFLHRRDPMLLAQCLSALEASGEKVYIPEPVPQEQEAAVLCSPGCPICQVKIK